MDNTLAHSNNQSDARHGSKKKKFNMKTAIIAGSVSLVVIFLGLIGYMFYQSTMGANIDGGKYQAVFFTNGQVYFGKLQTLNGDYMKLTDIYYLQTKAAASSDSVQAASTSTATDVQLIKLGNEIHGPDDEMIISKQQILFFENLKKDSKVSASIDKYQKK